MSDSPDIPEYFEYDKRSYKIAKAAILKLPTEARVLEYLVESRPRCLNPGDSMLGMDTQQLYKLVHGVADKLVIHSYPERGHRLRYLYDILSRKLAGNEDFLKMIMKFLLEMSERPTSLLRLDVEDAKYSDKPDDDISEANSLSERELLKLILEDASEDEILVSYSSESELSNWSEDDDDNGNEQSNASSNGIVVPESNVKRSHTFSDFTTTQLPTDEETKQKELEEYWKLESIKAKEFWTNASTVCSILTPLRSQPVITGLLALHSKFGEYWEWKHGGSLKSKSQRLIIREEVLIREILWQFSILSPDSSQVFNSDWSLKSGLMTSCLSCECLSSFMRPVLQTLSSLSIFKQYVHQVYHNSTIPTPITTSETSSVSKSAVPPILLSYAHGLSDILNFISEMVAEKLEHNIKARKNNINTKDPPCSTLIQLLNEIRPYMDCIETLGAIHQNNFRTLENETSSFDNDSSAAVPSCLTLLYSLFTTLNVQRNPMKFGFVLYLFSKCLRAFLDEINTSLTLNWSENLLFNRFIDVKISDHNFWTECIKRRNFEKDFNQEHDIFTVSFFRDLTEDMLMILKTSEMIRQLDEDCVKIIGHPPDSEEIVEDFLKIMFPFLEEEEESLHHLRPNATESNLPNLDLVPEYEKHFRFMGLENSLEADSVKLILQELTKSQTIFSHSGGDTNISSWAQRTTTSRANRKKWLFNLQIQHMPKINTWYALETTLSKWYNPLSSKADLCIHQIFADYSVDHSLQLFREIILETREDFAQSIIAIVANNVKSKSSSSRYKWEGPSCRNPAFQKLLADCYPEGRDNFDIELKLDQTFDTNYTLVVKPHFPLNLVLFEDSIQGYLFVARQLSRIRKSLWEINALSIKDLKPIEGVEPNRMLLFRFAFLHFCSSLRAYLVFKVFVKDVSFCTANPTDDVDLIRRVHGGHLKTIEIELLKDPLIEKVILRKMADMSKLLRKVWHVGIPSRTMVLLEDTLKKCWSAILTFRRTSNEFNELAYHFGPIPSYL